MKIIEKRVWFVDDIISVCIRNDLYTRGNTNDYDNMLNKVRENEPTVNNIYLVAKDILEHTKNGEFTVVDIMNLLSKIVYIIYRIEE